MITKPTTSRLSYWRPDVEVNTVKQLVSSACELSYIKLSSGSGAAVVELYDAASSGEANSTAFRFLLDCSTTDNDTNQFVNPPKFERGIYAKLVQGTGYNPTICFSII